MSELGCREQYMHQNKRLTAEHAQEVDSEERFQLAAIGASS